MDRGSCIGDLPGSQSKVTMEKEEKNKEQPDNKVCCLEEFVVTIPDRLARIHQASIKPTYRIDGKDIKVKYAWGMRVATPDQYVMLVFHSLTMSPL